MVKAYVQLCAAKQCYNSRTKYPNMEFFGFPSDSALCQKWLENSGRTDLNVALVSKSSGYYRLCSDHFETKWFTDNSKTVLKRTVNPIPTIFINNVKSLLPRRTQSISMEDVDLTTSENSGDSDVDDPLSLSDSGFGCNNLSVGKQSSTIFYRNCSIVNKEEFDPEIISKALSNLNPETELHHLEDLCRFCMNKVLTNHVELFSDSDEAKEVKEICEVIMPKIIEKSGRWPQKSCQKCIRDLRMCHQLMEQFLNADRYLRAIAKYSLFIENYSEGDSIDDEDSVPKKAMVMSLKIFQSILEDSVGYLELSKEKQTASSEDLTLEKNKESRTENESCNNTINEKMNSDAEMTSISEISNADDDQTTEITIENVVETPVEETPPVLEETAHIEFIMSDQPMWQDNLDLVCNNIIILPNKNNILETSLVYEQQPTDNLIENNLSLLDVKDYKDSSSLEQLVSSGFVAKDGILVEGKQVNFSDDRNEMSSELSDTVLMEDVTDQNYEEIIQDEDLMYLTSLNRCRKCGQMFSSYSSLEDHYISTHQNIGSSNDFTCTNCLKKFTSLILLEEHQIFEHQTSDVLCEKCGENFNNILTLEDHIKDKHSFRCRVCEVMFPTQEILDNHVKSEHDSRIVIESNDIQQLELTQPSERNKHTHENSIFQHAQLHNDQTYVGEIHRTQLVENPNLLVKKYVCEICSRTFTKKQALTKHSHVHSNSRSFVRYICGKVFSEKESGLDREKQRDTLGSFCPKRKRRKGLLKIKEVPNLECDVCGRKFLKSANLARHRKYHFCRGDPQVVQKLLDESELHMCIVCGKQTYSRIALQSHSRIHTGAAKPFKCEFCSKYFASHQQINLHEQTHIGNELFMCKCCNKGFHDEKSLRKHELRLGSANTKPYICKICYKSFKTNKRLLLHAAIHKVVDNFPCSECNEVFSIEDDRQRHFDKLHKTQEVVEDTVEYLIKEPEIPMEYFNIINEEDEHFNDGHATIYLCDTLFST